MNVNPGDVQKIGPNFYHLHQEGPLSTWYTSSFNRKNICIGCGQVLTKEIHNFVTFYYRLQRL